MLGVAAGVLRALEQARVNLRRGMEDRCESHHDQQRRQQLVCPMAAHRRVVTD